MVRVRESSQLKTISFAGQSESVANPNRDSNHVRDNFFRDFVAVHPAWKSCLEPTNVSELR